MAIENILPTQAALLQHTKRAVYQSGHVWGSAVIAKPQIPSPQEWRLRREGSEWKLVRKVLPQAQESCYELIDCGCKKGRTGQCKCRKESLKCTALCNCGGHCLDD